jgi:hypothetical protein
MHVEACSRVEPQEEIRGDRDIPTERYLFVLYEAGCKRFVETSPAPLAGAQIPCPEMLSHNRDVVQEHENEIEHQNESSAK